MKNLQRNDSRSPFSQPRRRAVRPLVEGLEARLLLYAATGDQWTNDSRITYSFMPDGTSVGGVPSALFQTLNSKYATGTWENQIEDAASLWETAANVNLALVSDGGQAEGSNGDQQDDPRFGDIRIGMVPLPAGVLAETFLPPPANGGTDAGDILFNSTVNWQINSSYDLMTVAAHEFGHALGLGESAVSTAAMYGTYNGIKQALTSDDVAGIDSIYGTPQYDQFNNSGHHNSALFTATNINSYMTSNGQITLPSLDITTGGQAEWFFVNVPSTTTGTMKVTVQSSNLSSLAPLLQVYNSSGSLLEQTSAPNTFGATISLANSVAPGQGYYVKVTDAGGAGPVGSYGLMLNFGSQTQSPITPPNTVVAQQPDQGGGTENDNAPAGSVLSSVGTISCWFEQLCTPSSSVAANALAALSQTLVSAFAAIEQDIANLTIGVTQDSTEICVFIFSTGSSSSNQATSTTVATGQASSIFQAIDEALAQWLGDNN
jgi:Matrixin